MSKVESFREFVVARAGGACEYCRLFQQACGVTFHIDHAIPQSQGGQTVMSNLALCCPSCNMAKAGKRFGRDRTGTLRPLFNPRECEPWLLGWHLHFALDRKTGIVRPLTPVGEATIESLRMNDFVRVFARRIQIKAGLIA